MPRSQTENRSRRRVRRVESFSSCWPSASPGSTLPRSRPARRPGAPPGRGPHRRPLRFRGRPGGDYSGRRPADCTRGIHAGQPEAPGPRLPNTRNRIPFTRLPIQTASVKRLRVQQYQTSPSLITRMVFDLEEGHGTHELSVNSDSVRLVFHPGQDSAAPRQTARAAAAKREYAIKPYSPPSAAAQPGVAAKTAVVPAAQASTVQSPAVAAVRPADPAPKAAAV